MHFQIIQSEEKLIEKKSCFKNPRTNYLPYSFKAGKECCYKKELPFYKTDIDRPLVPRVLLMHVLQYFLFLRRQDHKFCSGICGLSGNNVGHERRYSASDSTKDEKTSGYIRHNLWRVKNTKYMKN